MAIRQCSVDLPRPPVQLILAVATGVQRLCTVHADIDHVRGGPYRAGELRMADDAKASPMFFQRSERLFVYPAWISKLEHVGQIGGQAGQELAQAGQVAFPARRQLIQDRPQLAT